MAKISMTIRDEDLSLIDRHSAGNRTAFMVRASTALARHLEREAIDAEIARSLTDDISEVVAEWDSVASDGMADGIDESTHCPTR